MRGVLRTKLLRDFRTLKGQSIAIAVIIACGVASFVTVTAAYEGLNTSLRTYYDAYRMPDLFAPVKKAPAAVARGLESVPGVRRVRPRIVFDVNLDLPGVTDPMSGRMYSMPDRRREVIGDVNLIEGRWFEGDGTGEVLVSVPFAEAHGLGVGDRLGAIMNNRKEWLQIAGIAGSPEFVYSIRPGGLLLPEPGTYTELWISDSFAESVFDFGDACNEVIATLERDAVLEDVIDAFDRALDPYGAAGAYGLKDQVSNRFLTDEIKGLEGSATIIPVLFLGVAAFVLNVLLQRLVQTQRTQIAVFRAFGYSRRELSAHYLAFALVIGFFGALIGCAVGIWWGIEVLEIYLEFYRFPSLEFRLNPALLGLAVTVTLGFAAAGALRAVRQVAAMNPAEAMRPEAPKTYGRTLLEHWQALWARLGFVTRMVMRGISRTKMRAATTVFGVGLATAILLLAFYSSDATIALIDFEFGLGELHDARVTFHAEHGRAALSDLRQLPGVRHVEPESSVPVRLHNDWRERLTAITGLTEEHTMRGLLDEDLRPVELPPEGLLLSGKMAELMGVSRGETLEVEVLTGRKQRFTARVVDIVDEYLGAGSYARIEQLSRWVDEELLVTGAVLEIDPDRADEVSRRLKDLPAVASVAFRDDAIQSFLDTVGRSQSTMNGVFLLFAGAIAFGVLYNASRIGLAEKARILASMRVMGFSQREASGVLVGENLLLTAAAIPPGLAIGLAFCYMLSVTYDTDLFRFPFVVRAASVARTVIAIGVFALLANLAVRRRLGQMDVNEILKARE